MTVLGTENSTNAGNSASGELDLQAGRPKRPLTSTSKNYTFSDDDDDDDFDQDDADDAKNDYHDDLNADEEYLERYAKISEKAKGKQPVAKKMKASVPYSFNQLIKYEPHAIDSLVNTNKQLKKIIGASRTVSTMDGKLLDLDRISVDANFRACGEPVECATEVQLPFQDDWFKFHTSQPKLLRIGSIETHMTVLKSIKLPCVVKPRFQCGFAYNRVQLSISPKDEVTKRRVIYDTREYDGYEVSMNTGRIHELWKKHVEEDKVYFDAYQAATDRLPHVESQIEASFALDGVNLVQSSTMRAFNPNKSAVETLECFHFELHKHPGGHYNVIAFLDYKKLATLMVKKSDLHGLAVSWTRNLQFPHLKYAPFALKDTSEFPPVAAAAGFQLELRDYQKNTLSWLMQVESEPKKRLLRFPMRELTKSHLHMLKRTPQVSFQLGQDGPYFDKAINKLSLKEDFKRYPVYMHEVPCNGAILADNPGTGKTIVALALIHSRPFRCVEEVPWPVDSLVCNPETHLVSRATLIVCPSHLVAQWRMEALRCMPNAKVYKLTTIIDHRKLTWNDVLLADIIIASMSFLQNENYKKSVNSIMEQEKVYSAASYMRKLRSAGGREIFGKKKNVLLQGIMFHRIICDEFHELGDKTQAKTKKAKQFFLEQMQARFYLGLTGTPQYQTTEQVTHMATYLNTELDNRHFVCELFLDKMVRRNVPNLNIPPMNSRLIWLEMTLAERGLYQAVAHDPLQSLMACNHFQLANDIIDYAGVDADLNIDQVTELVQKGRLEEIEECGKCVRHRLKKLEKYHKEYAEMLVGRHLEETKTKMLQKIQRSQEYVENVSKRRAEVERQFNYFQGVIATLKQMNPQTCPMCLDVKSEGDVISMAKCGHVHCVECLNLIMHAAKPACSLCRLEIAPNEITRIVMKRENISMPVTKETQKNREKYGSKLSALLEFLKTTMAEQSDAKIILFIQFRRLMGLVGEFLETFQVGHVQCVGSVHQRTNAIQAFKTLSEVKILLLSSEDSVSGLHLTEATHVVILHPFLIGQSVINRRKTSRPKMDEDSDVEREGEGSQAAAADLDNADKLMTPQEMTQIALSYEKQGIARAWRGGQTKKIELVRFLVRDSIEEELCKVREYREGVLQNLDKDYCAVAEPGSK